MEACPIQRLTMFNGTPERMAWMPQAVAQAFRAGLGASDARLGHDLFDPAVGGDAGGGPEGVGEILEQHGEFGRDRDFADVFCVALLEAADGEEACAWMQGVSGQLSCLGQAATGVQKGQAEGSPWLASLLRHGDEPRAFVGVDVESPVGGPVERHAAAIRRGMSFHGG